MVRNDVPQTVGAATEAGWQYLAIRCAYCRGRTRVMFGQRDKTERLPSIIERMRCSRCPSLTPSVDAHIGAESYHVHEKPIGAANGMVYKIGMT